MLVTPDPFECAFELAKQSRLESFVALEGRALRFPGFIPALHKTFPVLIRWFRYRLYEHIVRHCLAILAAVVDLLMHVLGYSILASV